MKPSTMVNAKDNRITDTPLVAVARKRVERLEAELAEARARLAELLRRPVNALSGPQERPQ